MTPATASRSHTSLQTSTGPVLEMDGAVMLGRFAQRAGGAGLIFAALGLWVFGTANWEPDIAMLKLLLSLAMVYAGIAFLQEGRMARIPEVEVDLIAREVRLLRRSGEATSLIQTHRFEDLGTAEETARGLVLRAPDGAMLAEVEIDQPKVRLALYSALEDAGKLIIRSRSVH